MSTITSKLKQFLRVAAWIVLFLCGVSGVNQVAYGQVINGGGVVNNLIKLSGTTIVPANPSWNFGSSVAVIGTGSSLYYLGTDSSNNLYLSPNSNGAPEFWTVTTLGNFGLGSTSPFAKYSIQANPTDLLINKTLFAIGSSTATGTSTLLSLSNSGFFALGNNQTPLASPSGTSVLAQLEGGDIILGNESNTGVILAFLRNSAYVGGFSTASSLFSVNGNGAGLGAQGNSSLVIGNNASTPFGIGTTSPSTIYAKLSLTLRGDSGDNFSTAFLIASSSTGATTTLLSVSRTGQTTLNSATQNALIVQGSGGGGDSLNHAGITLQRTDATSQTAQIFFTGSNGTAGNFWQIVTDPAYSGGALSNEFSIGYGTANQGISQQALTITNLLQVGLGTTTPKANFQVTATTSNATTTMEIGKANQTKGSCIKLYDSTGAAWYYTPTPGTGALTPASASCASISGF